jgi:hypothetical protein
MRKDGDCDICAGGLHRYTVVDGVDYFECQECGSLLADRYIFDLIDEGKFERPYDATYWEDELHAAKERSYGPALARFSELLLYARCPVERFLDVGSGPGYLLDALSTYLPASAEKFWGVEMFAPDRHTDHPNFIKGSVDDLVGTFDAGICMEVVEHLTPKMLSGLAVSLARKSHPNSIYLINSGLPRFVKNEDPGYLDPFKRGHIASYSTAAIEVIFSPLGFRVIPLRGKDWAYLIEYKPTEAPALSPDARIWSPCPENLNILNDPTMGSLMYVLGIDTARAYG